MIKKLLKRIWVYWIKRRCPACGGRVHTLGPSDVDRCVMCDWTELDYFFR